MFLHNSLIPERTRTLKVFCVSVYVIIMGRFFCIVSWENSLYFSIWVLWAFDQMIILATDEKNIKPLCDPIINPRTQKAWKTFRTLLTWFQFKCKKNYLIVLYDNKLLQSPLQQVGMKNTSYYILNEICQHNTQLKNDLSVAL